MNERFVVVSTVTETQMSRSCKRDVVHVRDCAKCKLYNASRF